MRSELSRDSYRHFEIYSFFRTRHSAIMSRSTALQQSHVHYNRALIYPSPCLSASLASGCRKCPERAIGLGQSWDNAVVDVGSDVVSKLKCPVFVARDMSGF